MRANSSSGIEVSINESRLIGGYFNIPLADGTGWRSFDELTESVPTINEYVNRTRAAIARSQSIAIHEVEKRVAASSFQLATIAKLISPVVGCIVLSGTLPDFSSDNLAWRPGIKHSLDLGIVSYTGLTEIRDEDIVDRIHSNLIDAALRPLSEAIHRATGLSNKVLLGNIASSFNGAVSVLGAQFPNVTDRAFDLVREIVNHGHLRTTCTFVSTSSGRPRFVRNNCCLFYQLPRGGQCGDCILTQRAQRDS